MNTGTGALTIAGVRLADVALLVTALLLVLLTILASIAILRFFFDLGRRFMARSSKAMQTSS